MTRIFPASPVGAHNSDAPSAEQRSRLWKVRCISLGDLLADQEALGRTGESEGVFFFLSARVLSKVKVKAGSYSRGILWVREINVGGRDG